MHRKNLRDQIQTSKGHLACVLSAATTTLFLLASITTAFAQASTSDTPNGAESSVITPSAEPGVTTIGTSLLPQDLSPWGMFLGADVVVKAVMIGLAFASLVTWTVWLAKSLELHASKRQVRRALRVLDGAPTLTDAGKQICAGRNVVARLVQEAMREVQLSSGLDKEGIKERVTLQLERLQASAARKIMRGTGILGTIGATAPFVGLFGTVWGIMNSFVGISHAHTTNLAVVAPGIAEALLATALGLFAAIPAVVIYNVFSRSIAGYRAQLMDAIALVLRLVSRDCDREVASLPRAAE
jgi:biopolymer transport protein ExbB